MPESVDQRPAIPRAPFLLSGARLLALGAAFGAALLQACASPAPGPATRPEAPPAPAEPSTVPAPPWDRKAPRVGGAPSSTALARGQLAPGLRGFCVHGGAPLVGVPLVDAAGRLALVTQDGYLHSYEPDGRFRFSYTVSGTPLGSPSLRASDDAILLGTTARAVYGVASDGQLLFRAHTITPVWSGLHARDSSSVVYLGLDRFLYALSNQGMALYRVAIPGQPVGEPVVDPAGVVWIPLSNGLGRLEQAISVKRYPLSAPVDDLGLGGKGPLVVSAGTLHALDTGGDFAAHGAAATLLTDGTSGLVLDGRGGGAWLPGGDPGRAVPLGRHEALTPSGRGSLSAGRALLPLGGGEVALLDVGRIEEPSVSRVHVLAESLALARFTSQGRLLVASRSGRACLVDDPFPMSRAAASSQ